jgi:hypothetical protein
MSSLWKSTETSDRLLQLLMAKKNVWSVLHTHRDAINSIRTENTVHVGDILKSSEAITLTAQPTADWVDGNALVRCHYPAPVSEEMRAGVWQRSQTTSNGNLKDSVSTSELSFNAHNNSLVSELISKISSRTTRFEIRSRMLVSAVHEESQSVPGVEDLKARSESPTYDIQENRDNQARKRQRKIEVSYGLSDSDDSENDG